MIIFAEKNDELRKLFQENFPNIKTVDDMFSVPDPKVIVTCSNPWFSMGGGIDALIKRFYPEECSWIEKQSYEKEPGYIEKYGQVIFAVTVDKNLEASETGVKKVLQALLAAQDFSPQETIVFTGMGTGIGGLSKQRFIELFKEVYG